MEKLKSLLDNYILKLNNNASSPVLITGFFSDYILTDYESLKTKIEISYSFGNYEIEKVKNGEIVFSCTIKKQERSNTSEHLVKDIYEQIYIVNS
jgi:hypothetical protein